MRYVIAWQTKSMSAPAFWYYDVDAKRDRVVCVGSGEKSYAVMDLASELMSFVKDGSLVHFRPVKEK